LVLVSSKMGVALPKQSSVTINSVASTASAAVPCDRKIAATRFADITSPDWRGIHRARRNFANQEKPEQRFSKSATASASRGEPRPALPPSIVGQQLRDGDGPIRAHVLPILTSPRLASLAARISMSVTPPMAETTTTTSARWAWLATSSATFSFAPHSLRRFRQTSWR